MIKYIKGNILESDAQALVNTVNTFGVMGKGIALQFKKTFPDNFKKYKKACENGEIDTGEMFVTEENTIYGKKIIINFPTKKDWKKPSEYRYIEEGLNSLLDVIKKYKIKSIAIPPLGCGNGGLNWERVKRMIEKKLDNLDIDVYIYEPNELIKEKIKKERVKLTPARALMLYVLYDLARKGEFVSEFSAEKICYFLQRFGGEKYFNLKYEPKFYGPYSGKVRYVLYHLNGSYLKGYGDMNKGPFAPLFLFEYGYNDVKSYIESNHDLLEIAKKTINFLDGFYSDFALELLSTVDWIMREKNTDKLEEIKEELKKWSKRKKSKFSNDKYIQIALEKLKESFNSQFKYF